MAGGQLVIPFFDVGDRVVRFDDTNATATVTTAEKDGYVEVAYDMKLGTSRPILQFASSFKKVTP